MAVRDRSQGCVHRWGRAGQRTWHGVTRSRGVGRGAAEMRQARAAHKGWQLRQTVQHRQAAHKAGRCCARGGSGGTRKQGAARHYKIARGARRCADGLHAGGLSGLTGDWAMCDEGGGGGGWVCTRAGASVGWGGVHLCRWFAIEARCTPPRPTSAVHSVSLASDSRPTCARQGQAQSSESADQQCECAHGMARQSNERTQAGRAHR